jgi:hypothetical protein
MPAITLLPANGISATMTLNSCWILWRYRARLATVSALRMKFEGFNKAGAPSVSREVQCSNEAIDGRKAEAGRQRLQPM